MKRYGWIIAALLGIWVVGMIIVYPKLKKRERLQVFQPVDVNPKLVDGHAAPRS
jgi:hypothetical protein